jgi:hypothetical protein
VPPGHVTRISRVGFGFSGILMPFEQLLPPNNKTQVGTGFSNLLMLLPRRAVIRALFVVMMTLSNVTGAYLTYRWLRLQQGRCALFIAPQKRFGGFVYRNLYLYR